MLDKILSENEFCVLMKMHIYECIEYLSQKNIEFSVLCNIALVKFDPVLPDEILSKLSKPLVLFVLAGYTYESLKLTQNEINFEAGFGANNFASLVHVPLNAVVQILVENSPICVNFSIHSEKSDELKTKESMDAFMSNPKNRALFKK